jgi:MFS family permease
LSETTGALLARPGWQNKFPALAHPNYRLWFYAQVIAAFGMWMQSTAQGYLVYELTHSAAYLGLVSFVAGLPTWLFTLFGGVVADRVPRRTMLMITQSCMMILALILSALTLSHLVQPWHILVLAFSLGVVNAFDAPARQAFTLEVVDRQDLANAIALNAMMFNMATAVGPAAAGFIYALAGPGYCFLLNGLSFTGMLSLLWMMRLKPFVTRQRVSSIYVDLKEGFDYVRSEPTVRILLFAVCITSLFGLAWTNIIPAWAVRVLGGDATTNGLLQSARGLGSLLSALWIASLGRFTYKGKILMAGLLIMPLTMLIFSQVRWLPLSLLILVGTGMTFIPIVSLANALVQTHTPDDLRGRVMGIYTLLFMGMWPIGGLWAGEVAQRFGEPVVVVTGALVVLLSALAIYIVFPKFRALE